MARIRWSALSGTLSSTLEIDGTTIESSSLSTLPEIADPDYAVLIVDPDGSTGQPEIVYVTAHAPAATSATVLRGQETEFGGAAAREHLSGEVWVNGPTPGDFGLSAITGLEEALAAVGGATKIPLFMVDTDMTGGSFTDVVSPIDGSSIPRGYLVGLAVLVVEGDDMGRWTLTASGPCTPGPALTLGDTFTTLIGARTFGLARSNDGSTITSIELVPTAADLDDAIAALTAADIPFSGSGLTAGIPNVQSALDSFEGSADGVRLVRGYFTAPVPDLATLMAGPVDDIDQPVTDDGQQVVKGDFVATLGDTDGDGNLWVAFVDPTTGQWGFDCGIVDPPGADGWDNAISTNRLRGGNSIVSKSGAIGVFMGERDNGAFTGTRGGPDRFTDPFNGGEWVIVGGAGGGATEGYVDAKVADAINDGTTTIAPSQNAVFDALAAKVPTSRTLAGLDLTTDRTASALKTALAIAVADVSGAAPLASPAFTGTPTGITAAHVGAVAGDGTVVTMVKISAAAFAALSPPVSTTFYVVVP